MTKITPEQAKKNRSDEMDKIMDFFTSNKAKIDNIYYLKGRWDDEKEYEDFNEYKAIMEKHLKDSDWTFKSMTKTFKVKLISEVTSTIYQVSFNWKSLGIQVC